MYETPNDPNMQNIKRVFDEMPGHYEYPFSAEHDKVLRLIDEWSTVQSDYAVDNADYDFEFEKEGNSEDGAELEDEDDEGDNDESEDSDPDSSLDTESHET
ncbi:hypothetical protein K469DRAFT_686365 [Zopfia rhizophila CBS 207.26]|uniref:Uncharacterized protein n=1 Tax=Zopfia rhizophila CBS 207.26 TaxID=1314779 RepID=A0A6A6E5F5_9PEZI|nr:hypothetical protein K469DRAFT_686365 [Zopfia rhizophila CBS 207.26]